MERLGWFFYLCIMSSIIDIIILVIAIAALIWGAWKGFTAQLISIIGIFIGIWVASKLTPAVSGWVAGLLDGDANTLAVTKVVVYIVLVVLIIFLCHFLGKILDKAISLTILGGLNKLLGAVFCLLKALVILVALASLTNSFLQTTGTPVPEYLQESISYPILNNIADKALPFVQNIFQNLG